MSTHATTIQGGAIPQLTLGWRLKMALDQGGLSAQDMAETLEVHRSTVARWMADRGTPPRRAFCIDQLRNVRH